MRKGTELSNRYAIHLCNADRLRPRVSAEEQDTTAQVAVLGMADLSASIGRRCLLCAPAQRGRVCFSEVFIRTLEVPLGFDPEHRPI